MEDSDQPGPTVPPPPPPILQCECKYKDRLRSIMVYDPRLIFVPHPFIALYNYIALTEPGDSSASDPVDPNDEWKLRITKRIGAVPGPKFPRKDLTKALVMQSFVRSKVMLKPIHTESTEDFEGTHHEETRIFRSICKKLGIKIHHASLQDSKDPKDCEGQLTTFGLSCLTDKIEDGELALLFSKDRLDVVHNYCGTLFVLETNMCSWNLGADHSPMWKTLRVNDREEVLFTCMFNPLNMDSQPNSQENYVALFIKQWKQDEEYRKKERDDSMRLLLESAESKPKAKKKARAAAKTGDELVDDGGQGSASEKSGDKLADKKGHGITTEKGEGSAGAETTGQPPHHSHKWIKERFTFFLETFIDPEDDMPDDEDNLTTYVRMVEALKCQSSKKRSNLVKIDFRHIEMKDPVLALAILNDRTRLNDVLSEAFLEFRVKYKCGKKEELKGKIKLRFTDMPSADSLPKRFSVFLTSNNIQLAEPQTFYDNTVVGTTTYVGRIAGKGYVDYIIDNHRAGKSWNGQWASEDMVIKNGQFQIQKDAEYEANSDSMSKDFLNLIKLLFDLYKIDAKDSPDGNEKLPAYFDIFQTEIMTMMTLHDSDPKKFKQFQRYLSHHPAFKSPLVLSALFREVWRVIQSLRKIIPNSNGKRVQFGRLFNQVKEFKTKAETAWEFKKVYEHDNSGIGDNDKYHNYREINFLEFLRHIDEHLLDHTRDDLGVQKVSDIVHVHLMIGHTYEKEVSDLVFRMMEELNDAPFSATWSHYEMFEYDGKLEKIVSGSGKEKNVQSGGVDNSASGSAEVTDAAENTVSESGNNVQSGGADNSACVSGEVKDVAANTGKYCFRRWK